MTAFRETIYILRKDHSFIMLRATSQNTAVEVAKMPTSQPQAFEAVLEAYINVHKLPVEVIN